MANNNICSGTSVLNDRNIPDLNVSVSTQWAEQLFTMRRTGGMARIIMSFQLNDTYHNCVELYLFNCPSMTGINTPSVRVYFDESFRPERDGINRTLGILNTYKLLQSTSCDCLLPFCVEYQGVQSSRFINLEFPFENGTISSFIFLGEVKFTNGDCSPHDHNMVTKPAPPLPSPTGMIILCVRAC